MHLWEHVILMSKLYPHACPPLRAKSKHTSGVARSWENGPKMGPSQSGLKNELLEAIWPGNSSVHRAHLKGELGQGGTYQERSGSSTGSNPKKLFKDDLS